MHFTYPYPDYFTYQYTKYHYSCGQREVLLRGVGRRFEVGVLQFRVLGGGGGGGGVLTRISRGATQ